MIARRATDGSAFGLDSEALRVRLYERGNNVPVTLILGKRNPTGTAVYAQVEGSPKVLLVGRILEYYVDRLFEEVGKRLQSGREPGVDVERADQIGSSSIASQEKTDQKASPLTPQPRGC